MNILNEICDKKKTHIALKKQEKPLAELKAYLAEVQNAPKFIENIAGHKDISLIAEIKKASPSAGIIREDFDHENIALTYQKYGASCLSILTDIPYFKGEDAYIKDVKAICPLPVLRKDFMIDPYQIYESKYLGADCILLIAAVLIDQELQEYHQLATELDLDVLVEIHDAEELKRALNIKGLKLLGINNRNLKTLEIDINTAIELSKNIPDHIFKVSESGIKTNLEVEMMKNAGFDAILVGESLMKQQDLGGAVKMLLTGS
jgi:indole-3-glycerol phosphate synthase